MSIEGKLGVIGFLFWALYAVFWIALAVTLPFVAVHFIRKWW